MHRHFKSKRRTVNSPSEKREHGDNRSYERPVCWTARRESRRNTNMSLVPANQCSFPRRSQNRDPWGRPYRIECWCTQHKIVCLYERKRCCCCLNSTRYFIQSRPLALQDTGALAAAEYGRLALWAHSPLFTGLGVASTAAGWCIRTAAVLVLCGVGVGVVCVTGG